MLLKSALLIKEIEAALSVVDREWCLY